METMKTITIHVQEIRKEKQVFYSSSAEINGKWYKVKFRKEVENAPKNKGLYDLTFSIDDASIESGKGYTAKDGSIKIGQPTIWIGKIEKIESYSEEKMQDLNRADFAKVFGE